MIKYTEKHTIPCYDTDAAWRLKPTSFMNMAQEAAGRHAVYLGFGYDDLIKTNTAWILSRVHVEFIDTPKWREEITLNTWHKGLNRLFFLRDFVLTDNEGRERVKATTSWLVLNLETRRLVRDPKLMEDGTICTENALETPADKVQMPKDVEPELVRKHPVTWSEIDPNGHVNNVKYVVWAIDAVTQEDIKEKPLKKLLVNYDAEVMPGDVVKISRVRQETEEGIVYYITGKVSDKQNFSVKLLF